MDTTPKLPIIERKKRIDLKKFELLARKVKATFEEEKKYLDEEIKRNENYNSSGLLPNL